MKRYNKVMAAMFGVLSAFAIMGFTMSNPVTMAEPEPTEQEIVYEKYEAKEPIIIPEVQEVEVEELVTEEQIEEEVPEYIEYTVQSGDSLWSIADKHYGSGVLYAAIASYNQIGVNSVIHPGDVLKIQTQEEMTATAVSYSAPEEDTQEVEEVVETSAPVGYNDTPYGPSSFDGELPFDEAVALLKDGSSLDTSSMEYMGNWRITGYDPHCDHCCGKHNGITASGNQAEFGVTAGCNNLPLGTKIYIEGYGVYRIDDVGGMSTNHIDIACPSHDVCYQMTGHANVYVISYPD